MNNNHITLAQSYVPWQVMGETFAPAEGLRMGTIFPELVTGYVPGESLEIMNFLAKREHREAGGSLV